MKKLILPIVLVLLAGCTQVVVDTPNIQVKVNTFLKDIDFENLNIPGIVDLTKYTDETPEMTAITPVGAITTE
jgi:hypothetical protein